MPLTCPKASHLMPRHMRLWEPGNGHMWASWGREDTLPCGVNFWPAESGKGRRICSPFSLHTTHPMEYSETLHSYIMLEESLMRLSTRQIIGDKHLRNVPLFWLTPYSQRSHTNIHVDRIVKEVIFKLSVNTHTPVGICREAGKPEPKGESRGPFFFWGERKKAWVRNDKLNLTAVFYA